MGITVEIPDVPDEVHANLERRAAAAGLPLEEYLRQYLTHRSERLSEDELKARLDARARVPLDSVGAYEIRRLRDASD